MKLLQLLLLLVAIMAVMVSVMASSDASEPSSDSSSKPPLERQPARVGAWKEIDITVNGITSQICA